MSKTNGQNGQELSERHKRFVEEYILDLNATEAYKRTGFKAKNNNVAGVEGHRLLSNPKIQAYLDIKRAELAQSLGVTQEKVLREFCRVAFFDPRKLYDSNGNLKPITELDDESAAVIGSIEVTEEFQGRGEARESIGFTKKVQLVSKIAALNSLADHLGIIKKKIELTGKDGNPLFDGIVYNVFERKALQPERLN